MKAITLITVIISLFFISCKKDSTTPTPTPIANGVNMTGNMFSPVTLTVAKGATVTWKNLESVTHTVTSNSNIFDSGSLGNGQTFSYTFSTAGNFPYHCNFHSGMTGVVIVQ